MIYPIKESLGQIPTGFEKYQTVFLPETIHRLNSQDFRCYFLFQKGKSFICCHQDKKDLLLESIDFAWQNEKYLDRNIVAIRSNQCILEFIKTAQIDYFIDPISTKIWLHQIDVDFIKKYLESFRRKPTESSWLNRLNYQVNQGYLRSPLVHLYLANQTDQILLNRNVAADIISSLKVNFCIGTSNDLIIHQGDLNPIIAKLSQEYPKISVFNQNPFYLFVPSKGGCFQ